MSGMTETLSPADRRHSVSAGRWRVTLVLAVLSAVAASGLAFAVLTATGHGDVTIRPVRSSHHYCQAWETNAHGGWYGGSSASDWPTGAGSVHGRLEVTKPPLEAVFSSGSHTLTMWPKSDGIPCQGDGPTVKARS